MDREIILSEDQLLKLKEMILQDIRIEQQNTYKPSQIPLTQEIKQLTAERFGDDYQLIGAISTIARRTFEVRHSTYFRGEKLEQAIKMTRELFEVISKYHRKDRRGT